jgi:uncharacterized protein (DUF488 family)
LDDSLQLAAGSFNKLWIQLGNPKRIYSNFGASPVKNGPSNPIRLFTIGHSNRSFEDFQSLLKEFQIQAIADIRRFPSSRKFPHFNQDTFSELLSDAGIQYVWFESLGGLRYRGTNEKSQNIGLRSPAFRNYADHMMTDEFQAAVQELLSLGAKQYTAIMCAERFFWKCHRRLLSDFLVAQGVAVEHILEGGNLRPHKLTPGAIITEGGIVTYPEPSVG